MAFYLRGWKTLSCLIYLPFSIKGRAVFLTIKKKIKKKGINSKTVYLLGSAVYADYMF
jgi:predicted nucleotidyltransferase